MKLDIPLRQPHILPMAQLMRLHNCQFVKLPT